MTNILNTLFPDPDMGNPRVAASAAASLWLALTATALAGFLDAVGFQQLNHLYVSFMSGNSTRFGMALAEGHWSLAGHAVVIISSFVAGAFAGTLISGAASRAMLSLLVGEVLLCIIAIAMAASGFARPALALIAAIMGMQNVMHRDIAGADTGKGFITGALFGLGQALAHVLARRGGVMPVWVNAGSWFSFVMGVGGGALSVRHGGVVLSLGIACLVMLFMIVLVCSASAATARR